MRFKKFLRILLTILIVGLLMTACSKSGPASSSGGSGSGSSGNGGGTGGGTGGGGTGGGNPGTGITLMRGTEGVGLFHDHSGQGQLYRYASQDGYASAVRVTRDSTGPLIVKMVNAGLGTFSATATVNFASYTTVDVYISNIHYFTTSDMVDHPDTAGKLQFWIEREDGQDVFPASGNKPAVKRIIQVPGWFPASPQGYGIVRLTDYDSPTYPVHPPAVTLPVLQEIFTTSRWKLYQFTWPY